MPELPYSVPDRQRRREGSWRFDALLLALVPFVQLGISFWVSVASLAALLTLIRLHEQLAVGFRNNPWILLLPPVMFAPYFFEFSRDPSQDLLRISREAVVACLMFWIIKGSTIRPMNINIYRTTKIVSLLAAGLFILTAFQFFELRRGIYFGFPDEYYALETGTIPTDLALLYSTVRPAATFAEPSYLAFILLSLLLILAARFDHDRKGTLAAMLVGAAGILSQAFSFLAFGVALVGVFATRTVRGAMRLFLLPVLPITGVLAVATVLALFGNQLAVFDRLQRLGDGTADDSIFARIFGPLAALPDYLASYPFGLPNSMVLPAVTPYAIPTGIGPEHYLMNGFINFFFQYGFLGGVIAAIFLVRRDVIVTTYLLGCMMFNGGFLTIDKLSVVGLSVALYHAINNQSSTPALSAIDRAPGFRRPLIGLAANLGRGGGLRQDR